LDAAIREHANSEAGDLWEQSLHQSAFLGIGGVTESGREDLQPGREIHANGLGLRSRYLGRFRVRQSLFSVSPLLLNFS